MRKRVVVIAAVLLVVAAGTLYWWTTLGGDTRIDAYRGAPHDRQLTVEFTIGIGDKVRWARFDEHEDRVVVTVRILYSSADNVDIGLPREATTTLDKALGDRAVIDGSTGEPIPEG